MTGKNIDQSATPKGSHPLSDLAEAESALQDLAGHDGALTCAVQTAGLDGLDGLKSKAQAWDAEQALRTFQGLTTSLTAELDLRALVHHVLAAALRVFGAHRGILFLGRGDELGLVPVLGVNIHGQEIESLEQISHTILGRGGRGEFLVTQDALTDPLLRDLPSVQLNQIHSVMCAPLVHRTERIGAIYLDAPMPDAYPPNSERLLAGFADLAAIALENARQYGELLRENARLRHRQPMEDAFARMIGSTPMMDLVRRRAQVASQMEGPILIVGERGTGRELLARIIHDAGYRSLHPFISLDCSAVPPEDVGGVLFGRTGTAAARGRGEETGILCTADRGTIYLGDAQHLDPELGGRLVGVLKEGRYRPIGGRHDVRVDARVILGTATDLRDAVEQGTFSPDLFRWATGLSLRVPPLRERMSDVPELVAHFVNTHTEGRRRPTPASFTPDGLAALQNHVWPGNVEELERVVHRALLLTDRKMVTADEVRSALLPTPEEEALRYGPWTGRVVPLSLWEREAIRQALVHTKGNRSEASKLLGVHRNTLVRKTREYGLE